MALRPAVRLWTALALLLAATQPRFCAAKSSQASTAQCNAFSGGLCGTSLITSDNGNCVLLRVDLPPAAPRFRMKCWGWGGRGMNGIGAADYLSDETGGGTIVYYWNNRGDQPGEMGDDLPFVDLGMDHDGSGSGVAQMSRTGKNVCAIDGSTRELKCFGDPYDMGQLGGGCMVTNCQSETSCCLGSKLQAVKLGTNMRATQVAAGGMQTCAIVENRLTLARGLKCFGRGGYIGYGDTEGRGNSANQMGDALPFVSLGTGRHPVQVASGHTHTCVLLDNGDVKCFGSNSNMALGLAYDSTNSKIGDQPGEMGDDLPKVDLGEGRTAVQICASGAFGCAIDDQANLRCWGNHPGRDSSFYPELVQVGSGTGAVVQIACGAYNAFHMCALFVDGRVKCWGSNGSGQLGLGDTNNRGQGSAAENMGDALPYVDLGTGRTALHVSAGSYHPCALLDNLQVKCWGSG